MWGAECRDGLHVCRHGRGGFSPAGPAVGAPNHMPGSPAGTFRNDAASDCGWAAWAVYLDGGSPPAGGTSGVMIHGNILDASMAGAVFINGGGDIPSSRSRPPRTVLGEISTRVNPCENHSRLEPR